MRAYIQQGKPFGGCCAIGVDAVGSDIFHWDAAVQLGQQGAAALPLHKATMLHFPQQSLQHRLVRACRHT